MVGSLNSAMTAALLSVRVEVANFHGLTAAVLPLNLYIGLFHIDPPSQRRASPAGPGIAETLDKMINSDKRKWLKKRRGRPVGCESASLAVVKSFL
jgi:hypothetical protein